MTDQPGSQITEASLSVVIEEEGLDRIRRYQIHAEYAHDRYTIQVSRHINGALWEQLPPSTHPRAEFPALWTRIVADPVAFVTTCRTASVL